MTLYAQISQVVCNYHCHFTIEAHSTFPIKVFPLSAGLSILSMCYYYLNLFASLQQFNFVTLIHSLTGFSSRIPRLLAIHFRSHSISFLPLTATYLASMLSAPQTQKMHALSHLEAKGITVLKLTAWASKTFLCKGYSSFVAFLSLN